ncbi:MAG: GNAT family N-acetyltransferase [Acidimicrobiia bacterium]|nr:GNAT family N-acetyltransferase [Acidimicrobiia bacterium]
MRLARYDNVSPTKEQRAGFSCGEPALDRWLATQARQSMASRDAVTYLLLDDDRDRIAGYYCLSAGSVRKDQAPPSMARRAPEPMPVVRMGRFAIDSDYQGLGWGAELLREALLSAVSGATFIGGRAVLVDAIGEQAVAFYRRFGFVASPIDPRLLLKPLGDIEASAGLP